MNSFIFYSIISYYVYHYSQSKTLGVIVSIIGIIIVLLVGLSRVYLGVHYPSDVLAGYIAGFFVFVLAIIIVKTLDYRDLLGKEKDIK